MSHLPDEVLARRAGVGRLECFEELLARYRERVYRICYRMAGNAEDAEDWAQECFVRIYQQLGHYDPERPFAAWLLRVVSNTCINQAKVRTRHQDKLKLGLEEEIGPAATATNPAHAAIADEEARAAHEALGTLSPLLRQAFLLWALEDLTFRELAEVLGVKLTTAAQRVRRAMLQIREQMRLSGIEVDR